MTGSLIILRTLRHRHHGVLDVGPRYASADYFILVTTIELISSDVKVSISCLVLDLHLGQHVGNDHGEGPDQPLGVEDGVVWVGNL